MIAWYLIKKKSIWRWITRVIYDYVEANDKYMLDYHETKESKYLQYPHFINWCRSVLSQQIPWDRFNFTHYFVINYEKFSYF